MDLFKQMLAQGFGYDRWWEAAMWSRLNDMLSGGFTKVRGRNHEGRFRFVIDGKLGAGMEP